MAQPVMQTFHLHSVDDIGHKCLHQHCARLILGNSAGAHLEECLGVKLTGG